MDREVEKWKLKSDGLVRQMEIMDKAFQERANTLQVKLSAQGKLIRKLLKRKQELEGENEEMSRVAKVLMEGGIERDRELARLRKMLKGRCTDEEWETLKEGEDGQTRLFR